MLVMLGASGIANAQQMVSCANANMANLSQFTVIGDMNTACSIDVALSASASIEILGSTITDTMPITNTAGNILMISQGNITVSATITGAPNFNIDIKANQGGSGNLTIGTGGIMKIVAMPSSIVYVTNGTSASTGTLQLKSDADISLPANSGDYIILNAQAGTLKMPGGTLKSTGSPAGQIQLLAATVEFPSGGTLSTNQTSGNTNHGVAIAAATITYGGTAGLKMTANGNGALLICSLKVQRVFQIQEILRI